jgi:hypothetical protein
MNSPLRESLDRTLLLMRDELREDTEDLDLLTALTSTEVLLVGDVENLSSHAAQCAFVTAALLMARSGHRVYVIAPDIPLIERQPPLNRGTLLRSLIELGNDLLPGIAFSATPPRNIVDVCVTFGDSRPPHNARHSIALNASEWSAYLGALHGASRWRERHWPLGSLAAGALAAGEVFKIAMHRLRRFARAPANFDKLFALNQDFRFDLARPETPQATDLGAFDCVSGGAITNAALFCLLRIPRLSGTTRVIEDTSSDYSNLNRYALLRCSDVFGSKAETLLRLDTGNLKLEAATVRYDERSVAALAPLAPRVLVGVDHIPTRWLVQQMQPRWLGIGATTHWNAMTSFHEEGRACARCLHPRDDDNDARIPTVAFVSFWSGLLLAAYLTRSAAGELLTARDQHVFLTPLRPESVWWGPIARRSHCSVCGRGVRAA